MRVQVGITDHVRNKSFPEINCTGIDKQMCHKQFTTCT